MTVYIIQQPRPNKNGWTPDLTSARDYGAIEFVFEPSDKVYALPGPSLFKARKFMRENFNDQEDYILWPSAGDPMAFAALMLALKDLDLKKVRFLIWDRKRDDFGHRNTNKGEYVPCTFILREEKSD